MPDIGDYDRLLSAMARLTAANAALRETLERIREMARFDSAWDKHGYLERIVDACDKALTDKRNASTW